MSWRGQGKRARGRRDQDADLDNTAWLEELERAAAEHDQDDDEEEWASKLRRRRSQQPEPPPRAPDPPPGSTGAPLRDPTDRGTPSGSPGPPRPDPSGGRAQELPRTPVAHDLSPYPPLGSEPAAPPPPPPSRPAPGPAREPDDRLLGTEPDTRRQGGDWDAGWDAGSSAPAGAPADWTTRDPSPAPAGDTGTGWPAWEPERAAEPDWYPAGPDAATGAWSPAEPVDREPDYPALFGELNRRSAAQREALWDSAPAPAQEPHEDPGSPDPPAPTWPFEESTGTWEPSDRSFIWPAEELPATSSEWEPSTPSWLDEPTAQPPAWQAPPAGTASPTPPPAPPDDWAAGIQSGVPPAAPAWGPDDTAARQWRPDEAVYTEPAVPLGANGTAPPRPAADRVQMAEPADHWEPYERPRSSWPKVVAIVSWIVLLMVVCWFYVFPWLEQVLPENF
jgi:hypothetical protein